MQPAFFDYASDTRLYIRFRSNDGEQHEVYATWQVENGRPRLSDVNPVPETGLQSRTMHKLSFADISEILIVKTALDYQLSARESWEKQPSKQSSGNLVPF